MVYRPIIIVAGEPNSIFSEIFLKSIKYKKFKSPIILIASYRLIQQQMKKLNIYGNIFDLDFKSIWKKEFNNIYNSQIEINFKKPNILIKNIYVRTYARRDKACQAMIQK